MSRSAIVLWITGCILNAALLAVLFWKRRAWDMPWFTAWVAWAVATSVGLFFGRAQGDKALYAGLYWTAAFVELVLELAVVFELAAVVFRRREGWIAGSRARLSFRAGASVIIATVLALWATPAVSNPRDALFSRISLFETLLFTGLFFALMTISQELGVSWRDLVVREGAGFLLLNLCSFLTDTLHVYWRTSGVFGDLEHLRMAVYLAVLAYWCVVFWLPERAPMPLEAGARKKLGELSAELHGSNRQA